MAGSLPHDHKAVDALWTFDREVFASDEIMNRLGDIGRMIACALDILRTEQEMRTTEDMLLLVPNQLREAASALGLPRSLVIKQVAYKAARTGIITGILLATARVAGETAPLLFTALSNQFWMLELTKNMAKLTFTIYNFV
jgi:phosphate transport system permease protein